MSKLEKIVLVCALLVGLVGFCTVNVYREQNASFQRMTEVESQSRERRMLMYDAEWKILERNLNSDNVTEKQKQEIIQDMLILIGEELRYMQETR